MSVEITFGEFVPAAKINPFADTVNKLNEALVKTPNASFTVTVPAEDAPKTQLKIQQAANAIGKTAKNLAKDESVKGKVSMTFTLVPKHKARRGSK